MRALCLLAIVLMSPVLSACAHHPRPAEDTEVGPACAAPALAMVRSELVFGTARPDGRVVSDPEWTAFLRSEVTPRFPVGLTVLSGLGQWQGDDGRVVRERSKVLMILHEPTDRAGAEIEAIRDAYRRQFDQESVMRIESVSCVRF